MRELEQRSHGLEPTEERHIAGSPSHSDALHWSVRPDLGDPAPLQGPGIDSLQHGPHTTVLSQMNTIEAGHVLGWACVPENPGATPTVWFCLLLTPE